MSFCLLDKVVPGLEIGAGMNKQFLLKWMRLYSGAEVKERKHRIKEVNQGWGLEKAAQGNSGRRSGSKLPIITLLISMQEGFMRQQCLDSGLDIVANILLLLRKGLYQQSNNLLDS